ncbi:MAG: M15 family metallopeptidase [Thermaceae bacterium]|nr:M15 family metallopeptidase [Thermaceae bacterium]
MGRGKPGQPYSVGGYNVTAPSLAEYPRWRIITNALPGQSLHNYLPALAFDVAFQDGQDGYSCAECFQKFAGIAKFFGLEWGGDWPGFKDTPHFQPPRYTWQMAQAGVTPSFQV